MSRPVPIDEVTREPAHCWEIGLAELDSVLGKGIADGAFILLGGEPGIGKSTLLLQVAYLSALQKKRVLYISAEESVSQIKLRAERLGCISPNILLFPENDLDAVFQHLEETVPDLIIVDSIQTVFCQDIQSAPGTVSQVRESALRFLEFSKNRQVPVFLIGHVTKEGVVAGPRVLEHIVDTVLYFEGDKDSQIRILRAVKNRFGTTNEVGIFEMTGEGLKEIHDLSFFSHPEKDHLEPGCAFVPTLEGTRVIVVEIQALTTFNGGFSFPKRMASGIDQKRLSLIVAVLEKYLKLQLTQYDVYLNVVGGLKVVEPFVDLACAYAIWSSHYNVTLPHRAAFMGEIALTGELRSPSQKHKRMNELKKMGFHHIYMPKEKKEQNKEDFSDLTLFSYDRLQECLEQLLHYR